MSMLTKNESGAPLVAGRIAAALPAIQGVLRISSREGIRGTSEPAAPADAGPDRRSGTDQPLTTTDGPPWLVVTFTAFVIPPVIAASIYFGLLASDQFASELSFVVRGSVERLPGTDALGSAGGMAYLNSNQEVYAIVDYIRSRSIIDDVGKTTNLRRVFRADAADWLSRIEDNASDEELLRYWHTMITATAEPVSGLVSVEARAFTPHAAESLATEIRQQCEALVNRMQARLHSDMLVGAEEEVRIALEHADHARAALARFRNGQATVNPLDTARSLIDNVTDLKQELIKLDVTLAGDKASMGPDAPTVRALAARRSSLVEQIQVLEQGITSTNSADSTAASLLVNYDRLEVEQTLAEQQVAMAERIRDELRADANHRQVYIEVIEGPTTPERALYPKRMRAVAQIAVAALALWTLAFFAVAGIREHAE